MLSTHPKKTTTIHVRCTEHEREAIIARATRAGKSVSDYVRGAAMHYAVDPNKAPLPGTVWPLNTASKFMGPTDGRGGA